MSVNSRMFDVLTLNNAGAASTPHCSHFTKGKISFNIGISPNLAIVQDLVLSIKWTCILVLLSLTVHTLMLTLTDIMELVVTDVTRNIKANHNARENGQAQRRFTYQLVMIKGKHARIPLLASFASQVVTDATNTLTSGDT